MIFSFSRPRIEDLDHYLARREYDKALTAVTEALKKNPSQFNLLLRQAEILGLAGNRDKAITLYRELAEGYARDGFYAKAIALYKKILKLDPDATEVHEELARLIEEDRQSRIPLEERLAAARSAAPQQQDEEHDGDHERRVKQLQSSALFAAFEKEALLDVLTSTTLRSWAEGDIIVTEGEPGDSLFLIASGTVKVFTRGEHGEHIPLGELGEGDFFGEVSLLTGKPRTATITAKTAVLAIELDRSSVERVTSRHPEVLRTLEEFCHRRAQGTVEAIISRMRASQG